LRAGVYLCICSTYYDDKLDLDEVRARIANAPEVDNVLLEEGLCSEADPMARDGLIASRKLDTFIVAACAANEKKFRKSVESRGVIDYRMKIVRMAELCRRYPDKQRATDALCSVLLKLAKGDALHGEEASWVVQ